MRKLHTDEVEYRGGIIGPEYYGFGYTWELPEYVDCDWDDGWHCTGCGFASTIEEAKEEIDEYLNEMNQAR